MMRIPSGLVLAAATACLLLGAPWWSQVPLPISHAQEDMNRYEVAGITDAEAFEQFYRKLQKWVNDENRKAVARHVKYPLRVNKGGQSRFVDSEKQFLDEYDQIMTEKVRHALLQQDVRDTFVNFQGVMVGNGELWLRQSGDKFVIVAINQEAAVPGTHL